MRPLDWAVMIFSVVAIVSYGLWKARGSDTTDKYLRAGRTMPWYAMALSIMATQASAITFISTTGQGYVDGMRFVQFYFGLPLAMVILSFTAVPIFHRANVYTAYEYLEQRFDSKTRTLVSIIFLIQRGLAVGLALSAPAIVLTVILGWPDRYTTIIMGVIVVAYTVFGGVQAVTWTDFHQMLIMMAGLAAALIMAIYLLPEGIGLSGALTVAGAAGKLNPVTTNFTWDDRYNIWSGIFGGTFLALSYFGCDQSQVQRYLTGKSIAQSRLSLLFNAVAKIPMQFLILLTGAIVFAFFTFVHSEPALSRPEKPVRSWPWNSASVISSTLAGASMITLPSLSSNLRLPVFTLSVSPSSTALPALRASAVPPLGVREASPSRAATFPTSAKESDESSESAATRSLFMAVPLHLNLKPAIRLHRGISVTFNITRVPSVSTTVSHGA